MKKNKKLLMLGIGITAIAAPVATVVSCSNNTNKNEDQIIPRKLDPSDYKTYSSFDSKTGTLTIAEGISEITNVFENGYLNPKTGQYETIRALKLPSTLTTIDRRAFNDAQLLKLTIPNGTTYIGQQAFANSKIQELIVPNSVTSIGDGAFAFMINAKKPHATMPSKYNTMLDLLNIFNLEPGENTISFTWT